MEPKLAFNGPPDPDLVRVRELVYQVAGIFHPDNKLRLLLERCGRRMKELKVPSLRQYLDRLTARASWQTELVALLNEITIGETCFFRNQPELDAMRLIVIPRLLKVKARPPVRELRIWSAGCSTGEEPYTLGMLLLGNAVARPRNCSVEILATDLSQRSLAHARNAVYGAHSTRKLTTHYRQKYFVAASDQLQVQPAARTDISFTRLNLSDDVRMEFMKALNVIFCCNVLIYFDLASKAHEIKLLQQNSFALLLQHYPQLKDLDWASLTFELDSSMEDLHTSAHAVYRT